MNTFLWKTVFSAIGSTTSLSSLKRSSDSSKVDQPEKKKINLTFGKSSSLKKSTDDASSTKPAAALSIKLASVCCDLHDKIKMLMHAVYIFVTCCISFFLAAWCGVMDNNVKLVVGRRQV